MGGQTYPVLCNMHLLYVIWIYEFAEMGNAYFHNPTCSYPRHVLELRYSTKGSNVIVGNSMLNLI